MKKKNVALIFDIGKTHKKSVLFNEDYHVLEETDQRLDKTIDENGFETENLFELERWLKDLLKYYLKKKEYNIRIINFSTYGASMVHINEQGKPVTPLYNYLTPYPEKIYKKFKETYGDQGTLSLETSSPVLGMLNTGLQLYLIKHEYPELFEKIKFSLHLPQYLSYLLSKKVYSEITSFGCHTLMWNFEKGYCHKWVYDEGIFPLFPPMVDSVTSNRSSYYGKKIDVGIGIHDSSAALVPYLKGIDEDFVFLTTGTWNIAFNPFDQSPLNIADFKNDCLQYLTYTGRPVKASRLFLGKELEEQLKRLNEYFNVHKHYYKEQQYNIELATKAREDLNPHKKFYPISLGDSAPISSKPDHSPDFSLFCSFEEAYHYLIHDLVAWQALSLNFLIESDKTKKIIVGGGFLNNAVFMKMLADRYPSLQILATHERRASALGAAMVQDKNWNPGRSNYDVLQYEAIQ